MKKNRTVSVSERLAEKKERHDINSASFAGLIPGFFLLIVFSVRLQYNTGIVLAADILLIFWGLSLIILGTFMPHLLIPFFNILSRSGSVTGKYLLRILVFPVWLVIAFISVFTGTKTRKKYGFTSGKSFYENEPSYRDFSVSEYNKSKCGTVISVFSNVFSFFAEKKMYYLIPIAAFLLIAGLVFFFASANSVFAFIYTLF